MIYFILFFSFVHGFPLESSAIFREKRDLESEFGLKFPLEINLNANDSVVQKFITEMGAILQEMKENLTDFTNSKPTNLFNDIPQSFMCDLCKEAIKQMKAKQQKEGNNFEKNLKNECSKGKSDPQFSTHCDLINKINLDRLSNDSIDQICVDEKFCSLCQTSQTPRKDEPTTLTPLIAIDSYN